MSERLGWAYCLRVIGPTGPIKIGFTNRSPLMRAREMEQSCPYPIEWCAAWRTTKRQDRESLRLLRPYAIKREWFFPVAQVIEFIEMNCPGFDREKAEREMFYPDIRDAIMAVHAKVSNRKRTGSRDAFLQEMVNSGVNDRDLRKWISEKCAPEPETALRAREFLMSRGLFRGEIPIPSPSPALPSASGETR